MTLNIFENVDRPNPSNEELNTQRKWTRAYVVVLIIIIASVIYITMLSYRTDTTTLEKPTLDVYAKLPKSADCFCTNLSIPYHTFVNFNPQLHEVCKNHFIEPDGEWMSLLYDSYEDQRHNKRNLRTFQALTTNWHPVVAHEATSGWIYMQAEKYNLSSCNCATMPGCVEPMSLELNTGSNWTVPGMMIGCLPLESMLESTLECIYDQYCLNTITQIFLAESIQPLFSTRTRFKPINTTKLTTIASELFIEDWGVEFIYEKYFASCQPKTCSYVLSERF
ncbi:unnamed protein product [Adineta steineri]|uniref:Uncharacterized protein n=1 Tax=Adineta steineri TaxID=433720 RepID=A0A814TXA4_9BILA|nr:unnamed protein product [Adineta steineri]CAF1164013.1 unnamed protein product [Adineta steineri]